MVKRTNISARIMYHQRVVIILPVFHKYCHTIIFFSLIHILTLKTKWLQHSKCLSPWTHTQAHDNHFGTTNHLKMTYLSFWSDFGLYSALLERIQDEDNLRAVVSPTNFDQFSAICRDLHNYTLHKPVNPKSVKKLVEKHKKLIEIGWFSNKFYWFSHQYLRQYRAQKNLCKGQERKQDTDNTGQMLPLQQFKTHYLKPNTKYILLFKQS